MMCDNCGESFQEAKAVRKGRPGQATDVSAVLPLLVWAIPDKATVAMPLI
jgi:ribosomal protein S26